VLETGTEVVEANDALVGTIKKRDESTAQDLRVKSLREYGRLSRVRFNSGYAGYLAFLSAFGVAAPLAAAFIVVKRTKELIWIAIGYAVLLGGS